MYGQSTYFLAKARLASMRWARAADASTQITRRPDEPDAGPRIRRCGNGLGNGVCGLRRRVPVAGRKRACREDQEQGQ